MDFPIFETRMKKLFNSDVVETEAASAVFPFVRVKPEVFEKKIDVLLEEGLVFLETIIASSFDGEVPDKQKQIELIYLFRDAEWNGPFALKACIDKDGAQMHSIAHLWSSAKCCEQEIAEMFGVTFQGMVAESFLLPEGWVGHPLRKDYEFPESFNGVEHRREPLRKEHARS